MKDKFEKLYSAEEMATAIIPKGYWTATQYGQYGTMIAQVCGTNVVTTNGKDFIASFLVSAAATASTFTMVYIACGTGSTAETVNDSALVSELKRVVATASHNGAGVYQLVASFNTNSAVGAVAEFGIFNSASAGTLLARDTESILNIGATDTLTVTAQITLS